MRGVPRLVQFLRDQQRRLCDALGLPEPAWTIWHPDVPDARVRDPKKRGLIASRDHGPLTRIHCTDCGDPSPYAATEGMLKTFYVCQKCVALKGDPPGRMLVPGTERL